MDDATTAANTTATPRRLTRTRHDRIVAGVAGGLGRHFGIDPVIFRIAFVALAFFGGSGLALYVIAWLLVPEEDEEQSIAARALAPKGERSRFLRLFIGLALAVAVVSLLGTWTWSRHLWAPRGIVIALVAAAVVGAVVAGRRRGENGRLPIGRLLGLAVAALAAVGALAVASLLAIVAMTGVPLKGGVGDRAWHPASPAELRRAYHLGAGNLQVDLSDLQLRGGTTRVEATVGVGHLLVRVPAQAVVSVAAHSGAGEVVVFGDRDGGLGADRAARGGGDPEHRLVLDAKVGIGQVEVERAA